MSRILLFGGSGFIGKSLRAAFSQDSRVSWLACPRRSQIDLLTAEVDELASLLDETAPDVLVNCTGRLDGTGYQLIQANTAVTAKLSDAVARANSAIRLVRLGSAGEYGNVPYGHAAAEVDPAAPASSYGWSHLAATHILTLAKEAGLVDGVTLRVFNPVGPGLREETVLGRAALRLRDAVASGAGFIDMGPLSAYRDFVDVRDVATAVIATAFTPTLPASVLNVGSGRAITVREVVDLLAKTAGFTGEVREHGAPAARSAGVDWTLADITRASTALGWHPVHEIADSVKAIWAELGSGAVTRSQA